MSEFPPNLDDGELWLPSNVLTADDDHHEEEDEDDEQGVEKVLPVDVFSKSRVEELATEGKRYIPYEKKSPKSTLCGVSGSSTSSGSSPCYSQRDSGSDAWDLLDAAAMKLKANEVNWKTLDFQPGYTTWPSTNNEVSRAFTNWKSNHQTQSSTIPAKPADPVPSGWWQQTRPMQGSAMRIAVPAYAPWASVQQGVSSMKAVFLEPNRSGRESGGTGVFLPRRAGNGFDSKKKKKPACSTVLLPYRVVQALNLNIQILNSRATVGDLHSWKHGSICGRTQIDNNKPRPGNGWSEQHKNPAYSVNSNIQALSPEISLPQDWTY